MHSSGSVGRGRALARPRLTRVNALRGPAASIDAKDDRERNR